MHTETIDTLFSEVIGRRGIHRVVNKQLPAVLQLRYRHKNKGNVSMKTKLFYLQKAGVRMEHFQWTDGDMLSLLRFYINTSEMARMFGPEYVFEKWKSL